MTASEQLELTTTEQRLCLFLNLLDEDAREQVMAAVPEQRQPAVRQGLERLEANPPSIAEAEAVVDEFDRIFKLLGAGDPDDAVTAPRSERAAPTGSNSGSKGRASPPPRGRHDAGDPAAARLDTIDIQRLAAALRNELPQTVSVVVRQLSSERAGEMLARLPADLRSQVVIRLRTPLLPAPRLVEQIVAATLRRAAEINSSELAEDTPGEQKMAQVLRAMPRKDRKETLSSLGESDPELAEAVQSSLFEFSDLVRIDDRSVQALLSEIETESLSLALKGASDEYLEKIVGNLSRRAGEALAEEVAFMPPPTDEEQAAARQRVVQLLSKLDQDGTLRME